MLFSSIIWYCRMRLEGWNFRKKEDHRKKPMVKTNHFLTDIDSVTQSQYCTKTVYHVLVWECAVADPILDTAYKFGFGHQWRTQETRYNSLFSWDDEK